MSVISYVKVKKKLICSLCNNNLKIYLIKDVYRKKTPIDPDSSSKNHQINFP